MSATEIARIATVLQAPPLPSVKPQTQGRKVRTLCANCKFERLGVFYDSALMDATSQVSRALATLTAVPSTLSVSLDAGAIARAVLAHSLASTRPSRRSKPLTAHLTAFIRDASAPFPAELDLYCWVYPYPWPVIRRESSVWALTYFPLGFLATWQQPPPPNRILLNLTTEADGSMNASARVGLSLTNLPPADFPATPATANAD